MNCFKINYWFLLFLLLVVHGIRLTNKATNTFFYIIIVKELVCPVSYLIYFSRYRNNNNVIVTVMFLLSNSVI